MLTFSIVSLGHKPQWTDPQLNRNFWPSVNRVSWVWQRERGREVLMWGAQWELGSQGAAQTPTVEVEEDRNSSPRLGAHFIALLAVDSSISYKLCKILMNPLWIRVCSKTQLKKVGPTNSGMSSFEAMDLLWTETNERNSQKYFIWTRSHKLLESTRPHLNWAGKNQTNHIHSASQSKILMHGLTIVCLVLCSVPFMPAPTPLHL